MNETILNKRQKNILELLKNRGEVSRSELERLLGAKESASRATIIRDLNQLIGFGFVASKGRARSTSYALISANPLLEYIDLENYFDLDTVQREGQESFNEEIFRNLSSLFTPEEVALWEESAKEFKKRGSELDASIFKRELERFIIEFSWKSSQIEGNTYDLLETETLIKQKIAAKGHSKEEAVMILNHKEVFDAILKEKESFKKITLADLTQIHRILAKGLGVSSGVRDQPVRITGTLYQPLSSRHEIEEVLRKLIEHINRLEFPPEKALVAAAMVAYIQPFADGNKRTARVLSNTLLMAFDYFPLSYRDVDVNEYRRAMIVFYEQNNLYHLKRLFLEQLKFAVNNYFLL